MEPPVAHRQEAAGPGRQVGRVTQRGRPSNGATETMAGGGRAGRRRARACGAVVPLAGRPVGRRPRPTFGAGSRVARALIGRNSLGAGGAFLVAGGRAPSVRTGPRPGAGQQPPAATGGHRRPGDAGARRPGYVSATGRRACEPARKRRAPVCWPPPVVHLVRGPGARAPGINRVRQMPSRLGV